MKLTLTDQQIKEIADWLDSGMRCFYNRLTGEIKHILDPDHWIDTEEELWEQEMKTIEDNLEQYVEFTSMLSGQAFKVMVDFAENVDNLDLQYKLIKALERPKPFRNFKWLVDTSGPYRQKWFDFKNARYIQFVKEQIDEHNDLLEQQEEQEDQS